MRPNRRLNALIREDCKIKSGRTRYEWAFSAKTHYCLIISSNIKITLYLLRMRFELISVINVNGEYMLTVPLDADWYHPMHHSTYYWIIFAIQLVAESIFDSNKNCIFIIMVVATLNLVESKIWTAFCENCPWLKYNRQISSWGKSESEWTKT